MKDMYIVQVENTTNTCTGIQILTHASIQITIEQTF